MRDYSIIVLQIPGYNNTERLRMCMNHERVIEQPAEQSPFILLESAMDHVQVIDYLTETQEP